MALAPGTRLGPYEIVAAIGSGGMGEVYRGRDTRLDRTVAIKVLPESVAGVPDRLARFEREAKTLAACNHTNIAQVYGLEQGALAMEFVDGEDLSQIISRGPVPIDEALTIAGQIADALDAAHEAGIIHRDLKPSNVRVRGDGTVKVLDFGLAKALEPAAGASSVSTLTSPAISELGVILGTAGYMAPEQARGKTVDKRADIWAFGVVLYELTTGRRPFDGDTVTDAVAAVLKSDPDWAPVPPQLRRLIRSCLEKDPKRRLRDIGDWRRQLEDTTAPDPRPAGRSSWLAWGIAAVAAVAAGALAVTHFREQAVAPPPLRFLVNSPPQTQFEPGMSVAPDGRRVAFVARDASGVWRVWVRDFDSLDARPLPGTEGAKSPIWRPDGQFIAFAVDRWLKKVPVSGGPAVTLCEVTSANALGTGSWNQHGDILFGGFRAGAIRRVSEAGGGVVSDVTVLDSSRGELADGLPTFLPDGRHFLYIRVSRTVPAALYVGTLDHKPEEQSTQQLIEVGSQVAYVADGSGRGRLLFLRKGTLFAQPFDAERRVTSGEAKAVIEGIGNTGAFGHFSATRDALVYRAGPVSGAGRRAQLTWMDRNGKPLSVLGSPNAFFSLEVAPDGLRAAVEYAVISNPDIWLINPRGIAERFTSDPGVDRNHVWSPDGSRIAFQSNRNDRIYDLYVKSLSGAAEELLVKSPANKSPTSWSSDGQFLLYSEADPKTRSDLWVLPFRNGRTPIVVLRTEFAESGGRFSPDTRWIAYVSDASGQNEVYVRPFDRSAPGRAAQGQRVSSGGGSQPRWRRDGKELIFQAPDGTLMAVEVSGDKTLQPAVPRRLFVISAGDPWDVAPDGQRFLLPVPIETSGSASMTVVLNWTSDLFK